MSNLNDLIDKWFSRDFCENLAAKYQRAYAINIESHNPDEGGHDAQSFGFLNWKTRVHLLGTMADAERGITVIKKGKYFALGVGPFEVVPYNAGKGFQRNYAAAFPRNTTGAYRAVMDNIEQLRLPFGHNDQAEFDDSECRRLILADIGDYLFGLTALFVGVPIKTQKRKIGGWSRTKVLWERNPAEVMLPGYSGLILPLEQAPVEQIEKPSVKLKPIGKSNELK